MGESYYEKEHKKHLEVLKQRIRSCTRDELDIITETILEIDPDILLTAIHYKLKGDN